jgi:coenzyme F420-dependent glucose-6-phosphate dehydrogenase
MRYLYTCAHEQFPPDTLLRQAVAAEGAGFDGVAGSDHLQPWWEGGESGHTWVWLGAVGEATERVAIGTAVTPPGPRYHPVLIAQAWATLERLFPGRPFLGIGSGESLNESPLGAAWPSPDEQVERMAEGLELIHRLSDGETIDHDGDHFATKGARLYTLPERRPPIYVSAFGPKAAAVAGRLGDGLWTLADPEQAPDLIEAYRSAAEDAGREAGEVILQIQFSWAEREEEALAAARVWKGAQPDEFYSEDWHEPAAMYEHGERQVDDEQLREALIISSDPKHHLERIREIEELGATQVALMNVSGDAAERAIELYGETILPALRSVRA